MELQLAELAAGLPFALSFAMAGGISALREGRRRSALNEAVHELRRPLQVIALAAPAAAGQGQAVESSLRLAAAAVDRLEREINGGSLAAATEPTDLRRLVESAVERWSVSASLEKRAVTLRWLVNDDAVLGDPVELTQAVDNLISNGLVHGSGEVTVEARQADDAVRLVVLNRVRTEAKAFPGALRYFGGRLSGRRRHGHGLRIVRRAAERRGGSFQIHRCGDRCEARLDLPLCGGHR